MLRPPKLHLWDALHGRKSRVSKEHSQEWLCYKNRSPLLVRKEHSQEWLCYKG